MDENFRRQLEENGVEVGSTINRFMGNEAMYLKFLGKFLEDKNCINIGKNLEEENYEEAYKCAHTLKGVAANLGLEPLQKTVAVLVEELRGKKNEEVDSKRADEEWQKVKKTYEQIFDIISKNQ